MESSFEKFFLGANSCEGFVSRFSESYNINTGWKGYIIKGGPGTGKSSLMKRIAKSGIEKGFSIVFCPCSSDPDSLDAVIIKEKKIVILDGTSPHVVEPKLVGAGDSIVNLGEFLDSDKLNNNLDKVIEITARNKALHKIASAHLTSAGEWLRANTDMAGKLVCCEKAKRLAEKICHDELSQNETKGEQWERFLGGVTPKGVITYSSSITEHYEKIIVFEDKIGVFSNILLEEIAINAIQKGYETIIIRNPFLPNSKIDHILIPSIKTAFVTENEYIGFEVFSDRIYCEEFYDYSLISEEVEINDDRAKGLIKLAVDTLKSAKAVHDELEALYIPAMNFAAVNEYTDQLISKIFK